MPDTITTIENVPVLVCGTDGPKIKSESDTVDIIGEAFSNGVEWVVVPVERFEDDFFELKTRKAGFIIQKFVTYRRRLVILGDVSQYTAASRSFHDFVYEANRGQQIWFSPNLEELAQRLKGTQ